MHLPLAPTVAVPAVTVLIAMAVAACSTLTAPTGATTVFWHREARRRTAVLTPAAPASATPARARPIGASARSRISDLLTAHNGNTDAKHPGQGASGKCPTRNLGSQSWYQIVHFKSPLLMHAAGIVDGN